MTDDEKATDQISHEPVKGNSRPPGAIAYEFPTRSATR